jgi:DNA modification methylase
MKLGTAQVIRGNALGLPLADNTVDLIVTSPPYFGLRSYQDGGQHYDGQIGDEATPAEFVDALIGATREMVRVLKPGGSIFVNLGDKYAASSNGTLGHRAASRDATARPRVGNTTGIPTKSLIGIPWRYALRCIDDLGLILRAEIIWSKPNGLPESVTDRVRRSHETWFHFVTQPRYFSAVDEVREQYSPGGDGFRRMKSRWSEDTSAYHVRRDETKSGGHDGLFDAATNPLGKLPGSVRTVPTEPLRVPDHLGIDHFAAFPTAWPKWIIQGWAPTRGVCVECGEGVRPVVLRVTTGVSNNARVREGISDITGSRMTGAARSGSAFNAMKQAGGGDRITGYACACTEPTAATAPPTILDPFGGTGTTALVAKALGCHGISIDMSADYCRLAEWRTNDPAQLAKVLGVDKPPEVDPAQADLFDLLGGDAA